jgi:hypothetical protein
MSTLRANSILDSTGGSTATINGVLLRPGILDPENRIINGAMDFWQRGTSFTTQAYGADRWFNIFTGGSVTQSRQAFTVGDTLGSNSPTFFLRQSVSGQTLPAHGANTTQRIEGVRSYAGQTITVLGWVRRSSGSGSMVVEASQMFGTGGSPSAAVAAISPTTIGLTGSWAPFAATMVVPSITGKTLGTNGDDRLDIVFWASAGSDFNSRTNSLGLQTIGVDLWGIHIKLGTHTTAATDLYKAPELGPELARCQRYYEAKTYLSTGAKYASTSGNWQGADLQYEAKRASPAISLGASSLTSCTSPTVVAVNTSAASVSVTTAGTATYSVNSLAYTADAEL